MIKLLSRLYQEFGKVTPNRHLIINKSDPVTYPYLTYSLDDEYIERNVDGFYIDVDIFDKSESYIDVFVMEDALKSHFKDLNVLTSDFLLRFSYQRANTIDTQDDLLIRRNMQLYCKVDWRNK